MCSDPPAYEEAARADIGTRRKRIERPHAPSSAEARVRELEAEIRRLREDR